MGYYWNLKVKYGKKYRPDQPRVPAGVPEGGQWTTVAAGGGQVNYAVARASTWEEIEQTSNLFVHGEGEAWTDEEKQIAGQAIAEFNELNPFRPVTELVKTSGDDVQFLARSLGNGRVAVSKTFFDDYYLETIIEPQLGGRKGVLAHEVGHELADALTREQQDEYAQMWARTRDDWKRKHAEGSLGFADDYSNYDEVVLAHWPSYQAMKGWHEDLAESYRIYLGSGGEMGNLGGRADILKDVLGKLKGE
jgi:hypothetical protein